MKIVFVGPFGLQPKGTMSVRALPLARALVAWGHSVTMLIPPWDDPDRAGQVWEDGGVRVVNIALPPRLPLLFHILLARTLVAQALAIKPEVIHFFKPKAYAGLSHLVLWWLRRLSSLSLRLVVDADDWELAWNELSPYSASQKKLFAWQEKWGLRHADAITVASRALEKLVIAQRGSDSSRVFYLPNGCCPAFPVRMPGASPIPCPVCRSGRSSTISGAAWSPPPCCWCCWATGCCSPALVPLARCWFSRLSPCRLGWRRPLSFSANRVKCQ